MGRYLYATEFSQMVREGHVFHAAFYPETYSIQDHFLDALLTGGYRTSYWDSKSQWHVLCALASDMEIVKAMIGPCPNE